MLIESWPSSTIQTGTKGKRKSALVNSRNSLLLTQSFRIPKSEPPTTAPLFHNNNTHNGKSGDRLDFSIRVPKTCGKRLAGLFRPATYLLATFLVAIPLLPFLILQQRQLRFILLQHPRLHLLCLRASSRKKVTHLKLPYKVRREVNLFLFHQSMDCSVVAGNLLAAGRANLISTLISLPHRHGYQKRDKLYRLLYL